MSCSFYAALGPLCKSHLWTPTAFLYTEYSERTTFESEEYKMVDYAHTPGVSRFQIIQNPVSCRTRAEAYKMCRTLT